MRPDTQSRSSSFQDLQGLGGVPEERGWMELSPQDKEQLEDISTAHPHPRNWKTSGTPDIPSLLLAMLRLACTAGNEPIWSSFLGSVSVQLAGTCKSKPQELLPLHGWPNLVLHIQLGQSLMSARPPHLPYNPTNAAGEVEDSPVCNEPSRHSCADEKDNGQALCRCQFRTLQKIKRQQSSLYKKGDS